MPEVGTVSAVVDERAVAVAHRAAELARASGVTLPPDLALWRLAGGRPRVTAVPGRPEELGDIIEAALAPEARRRQGAHYTPAPLATALAKRALGRRARPLVGDPTCGGGALLLAAGRHLAARGEPPADVVSRLWGIDSDPLAVATTEAALTLWAGVRPPRRNLTVGDSLLDRVAWPPLDVVLGNPPFLSPLEVATGRPAWVTTRLRSRYGDAVRPYTDTAALFLVAASQMAAPGGTVALLQPQSVLAARDAAGVRAAVGRLGRVTEVWVPPGRAFEASVDVCVPIIEIGRPDDERSWSAHLARLHGVPTVELTGARTLGDEATTTAAFRSEYYGMVPHVHEQLDCPGGLPLVTTGLVDLGACAWGRRPARIGRRTWARPVLDTDGLSGQAAAWAQRTRGPKLVMATQTRVGEVVVDDTGGWVPAVPLVVALAPAGRLWSLAAALASPPATAWLLHRSAGAGLTAGSLKVTAALLRQLPLPRDAAVWAEGTDAFRSGDLDGFATAMTAAYDAPPEVATWWAPRARTVWSRDGGDR